MTDPPIERYAAKWVWNKLQVGRSVYDFYMIEWAGVDPEMEIRCGIRMRWMQIRIRPETRTTNDYDSADYYYINKSPPEGVWWI